jgi:hypothetical protein
MAGRYIADFSAPLTVGGTSGGAVTIGAYDPMFGPFIGAKVNLLSSGAGPAEYVVVSANPSTGLLTLRLSSVVGFGTSDVSAFTVAQTATLYLPAQLDPSDRDQTVSVTATVGGTVTATQGVANATPWNENVKQINGVTPLMGNGVTGTGSLRVTVASDNTAIPVIGTKTHNAAVPSTQLGVIPAVANAAAPTFTETYQTALSVDLAGNLRTLDVNLRKLNGQPTWLGNLVSAAPGTPVDNATTAVPFSLAGTEVVTLQSSVAWYMQVVAVASYTALGGKSQLIEANAMVTMVLSGGTKITAESVAGAATVRVFTLS